MNKLTKNTKPPAFRPATVTEYVTWLQSHLAAGGRITHAYDYPMARQQFVTATRDFVTDGECGAQALSIVVPTGVRHLGGRLGHNNLYVIDEGKASDPNLVPVFSDHEFDGLPGVAAAREADAAERAAREHEILRQEREWAESRSDVAAFLRSAR